MAHDPQLLRVHCPRCGKLTDRIEGVEAPLFVFLFVYYAWNMTTIVGCPRCVRNSLIGWMLASVPLANLFAVFTVPYHLLLIGNSFAREKPGIPDKYLYLICHGPPVAPPKSSTRSILWRTLLVVVILAIALGVVFFVLPAVFNP